MSKANQKKVAFDSGRRVGQLEALTALSNVILDWKWKRIEIRECCLGHTTDDFMRAVRERLE